MRDIDGRLEEMSDDLVHKLTCPNCDADLSKADIVEIFAPDDIEKKSKETYKRTVGGAASLAAVGALFGPAGVVAGGAVGSVVGGANGQKRDELRRVKVQCAHCDHHGQAL